MVGGVSFVWALPTEVLEGYDLGSSGNASKLKRVMQEREFVYLDRDAKLAFVDLVFRAWLGQRWG